VAEHVSSPRAEPQVPQPRCRQMSVHGPALPPWVRDARGRARCSARSHQLSLAALVTLHQEALLALLGSRTPDTAVMQFCMC